MKIMTVGEFKARFSEVIKLLQEGKKVGVTYGKKKETIGVISPYHDSKKKKFKRKLGVWEGKATVKFAKDFKMTVDEFLNLEESKN